MREVKKLESEYDLDKITRCIQEIDVAEWTSEMIQIQSYSFMDRQEEAIAQYICEVFQKEGIEAEVVEIEQGRFNVNARLARGSAGSSLMLSGHMDTVPAYDFEDAFSGRRADGKVYGRGACDMKGPLAAMMAALVGIHRSGVKLAGDLIFSGVADEEEKGKGVAYLIKNGPTADAVIVGEPTNMQVALGHKGLEWIEVLIHGKKVHGGSKKEGINAIQMASRFVNRIYDYYEPILDSREYPILGTPTINIGTITGGDQPSTVPGSCSIRLDRRCVPTETIRQVYEELNALAAELTGKDPRFHAEIKDVFEGDNLLPHEPFCTDPEAPIVKAVERAIGLAKGPEPVLTAFPAWTDAGFVSNGTDSTCLVMGPGELAVAHSVEEHIKEADLNYAALVYAYTAVDYCGIESNGRTGDGR